MSCDCAQLLALEKTYSKNMVKLYRCLMENTDRYSMSCEEDLYMSVSWTHFMQQVISELLAVSFVGEVVKQSLVSGMVFPDDGFSLSEFVTRVGSLTSTTSGPPGRDLKLSRAASRAWHMALSCLPGGVRLGRAQFEKWVGGSDVAWPAPEVDVLVFLATVHISEAVNGNEETGYMRSDDKQYPLRLHEHTLMFLGMMSGVVEGFREESPMNMRGQDTRLRHLVCDCPSCPSGNACERAEYEDGSAFRMGRCADCVGKTDPCPDRCQKCAFSLKRCGSCEDRRRLKPQGCPSNGENLGYAGPGCSGQFCRCASHKQCQCMKCMLGAKVCELLSPQRGCELMRIESADLAADMWGPAHCVGLETEGPLLQQGSAMRTLVQEAQEAQRLCEEHQHAKPWRMARAPECSSCLLKKSRPESLQVVLSGKDMLIPSCAVSLCDLCSLEVYGISKAMKRARLDCAKCTSAMDVLLARLARMDTQQYVSQHVAVEAVDVDRTTMPLPASDAVVVAKRCMDAYLEHTVHNKKKKVPKTCKEGLALACFKRCDTSKGCCPSKSGRPVKGAYDKLERGVEQSLGNKMVYQPSSKYVMGTEGVVLTTFLATQAGLDQRYIDAAKTAYAQSFTDLALKTFLSPHYRK